MAYGYLAASDLYNRSGDSERFIQFSWYDESREGSALQRSCSGMDMGSGARQRNAMPIDVFRWSIDRYDLLTRLAEGDAMRYIEL